MVSQNAAPLFGLKEKPTEKHISTVPEIPYSETKANGFSPHLLPYISQGATSSPPSLSPLLSAGEKRTATRLDWEQEGPTTTPWAPRDNQGVSVCVCVCAFILRICFWVGVEGHQQNMYEFHRGTLFGAGLKENQKDTHNCWGVPLAFWRFFGVGTYK